MKKSIYIAIAISVLAGSLTVSALAQTSGAARLVANIPFAFTVGEKTFPAGEYTLSIVNPATDPRMIQLRSKDGKTVVLAMTSSIIGEKRDNGRLLFNRYGERYFFAQVWLPADETGMQARRSRAERNIASQPAVEKPGIETVALSRQH